MRVNVFGAKIKLLRHFNSFGIPINYNIVSNERNPWKIIAISVGIVISLVIIGVVIYVGMIFSAMGLFDKTYDTADLISNYNSKRKEIYEVKNYINKITPKYKNVAVEFESNNEIARLDIIPIDTGRGSDLTGFTDWHLKIGSHKVDSLMSLLGWKTNNLHTLKEKLDNANCISVQSGEPSKIGFQRSGMGMYFFNVFDKPMQDSIKRKYNDSCIYIYANNQLILEYGGGAVGPQCFPRQSPSVKTK